MIFLPVVIKSIQYLTLRSMHWLPFPTSSPNTKCTTWINEYQYKVNQLVSKLSFFLSSKQEAFINALAHGQPRTTFYSARTCPHVLPCSQLLESCLICLFCFVFFFAHSLLVRITTEISLHKLDPLSCSFLLALTCAIYMRTTEFKSSAEAVCHTDWCSRKCDCVI